MAPVVVQIYRRGSRSCTDIKEIGSDFPDFRFFFKSGDVCPLTLVRTSCKYMDRPIRRPEPNGAVRMAIAPMVVEILLKISPSSDMPVHMMHK